MFADSVKDTIEFNTSGQIALCLVEPIQGAGGLYPMPDGFGPKVLPHVHKAGGLYLSDEV